MVLNSTVITASSTIEKKMRAEMYLLREQMQKTNYLSCSSSSQKLSTSCAEESVSFQIEYIATFVMGENKDEGEMKRIVLKTKATIMITGSVAQAS